MILSSEWLAVSWHQVLGCVVPDEIQGLDPARHYPGHSTTDGVQVRESPIEVVPGQEYLLGGDPYAHLTLCLSRDVDQLQVQTYREKQIQG